MIKKILTFAVAVSADVSCGVYSITNKISVCGVGENPTIPRSHPGMGCTEENPCPAILGNEIAGFTGTWPVCGECGTIGEGEGALNVVYLFEFDDTGVHVLTNETCPTEVVSEGAVCSTGGAVASVLALAALLAALV